jgi:hypothetical protein
MLFRHTPGSAFRSTAGTMTGRAAIACTGGIDTKARISAEVFVIDPRSSA